MSNRFDSQPVNWSQHLEESMTPIFPEENALWRSPTEFTKRPFSKNCQQLTSASPHSFLPSAEEFIEINPTSQRIWNSQSTSPLVDPVTNIVEEITAQNLYKTELCRSFEETGICRYTTKCQFAHGRSELRPVFRHPKYKTEVCKTFHTIGACPYGKRCRFIHINPETFSGQTQASQDSSEVSNIDSAPIPFIVGSPILPNQVKAAAPKPMSNLNFNATQWSSTWKPNVGTANYKPIGHEKQHLSTSSISNIAPPKAATLSPIITQINSNPPNRENERSRLAIFQQITDQN